MKYIILYENFKSSDDWKVGDILVAINNIYGGSGNWIKEDKRYKICEIVKNIVKPIIYVKDDDEIGYKYIFGFNKKDFITLEEWELKQSTNKYNI